LTPQVDKNLILLAGFNTINMIQLLIWYLVVAYNFWATLYVPHWRCNWSADFVSVHAINQSIMGF